jgi:hypothetical protein
MVYTERREQKKQKLAGRTRMRLSVFTMHQTKKETPISLLHATDHDRTGEWGKKPCLHRLLSFQQFQLLFHLRTTHLRVAHRGPDRWCAFHGHMSQIIGQLFQRPASLAGAMRKIVA